ncbi:MAG: hypothetical protein GWN94_06410 [Phycisphaerae bacterium]|nr:hypothetical protein [Phycisphaerae bacterium]
MNGQIQNTIKTAKAKAFSQLLRDKNPHILMHLIRPLNEEIRKKAGNQSRQVFLAMNIVMEYIMKLDPFPMASEVVVMEVMNRLKTDCDNFLKGEVSIASHSPDAVVRQWGDVAVATEIETALLMMEDEGMIEVLRCFFWSIFSCLRQAQQQ